MGLFDLFNNKKSKSGSTKTGTSSSAKRFDPPNEFDFVYHMLMEFASTLYSPQDLTVSISAYAQADGNHKAGEISLTLSSDSSLHWRRESLREEDSSSNKGLYNLFYGSACKSDTVIRYTFYEPECYIFGCPEGPFRKEAEEYCEHAYVDFYKRYNNGYVCAIIKFRPISDDQVYENSKKFQRNNRITFGI